jgi:hypothetical protein
MMVMALLVIESCHSRWFFDRQRMQFRRVLKMGAGLSGASTEWRPFYGLELDDRTDGFVVSLNPEGTRLLRSWRHLEGECSSCGRSDTAELEIPGLEASGSRAGLQPLTS